MFRFIHTSDWHLGQNFYGYDRSDEQRDFLAQLTAIVAEEQPDALLVSGDIFHTAAPSSAAVSIYVDSLLNIHLACPSMTIIVIAGNHDSASRLDSDKRLWELARVRVLGGVARCDNGKADLDRHIIRVGDRGIVAAVPFAYPSSFPLPEDEPDLVRDERQQAYFQALLDLANADNPDGLPVALMAHLAVNASDFTGHDLNRMMERVDISALGKGYDYVALGHIHCRQGLDERVHYCGTPIPVSFDERYEHSVNIVEIDGHGSLPRVTKRVIKNLKPLHTVPPGNPLPLDEALDEVSSRGDIKDAYIRLNVLVDGFLPSGTLERAASAVVACGGRFCELHKTIPVATVVNKPRQMTVEEFNGKQPIEIAGQYILEKFHREMTDQEKKMFNDIYQQVQEESRQ